MFKSSPLCRFEGLNKYSPHIVCFKALKTEIFVVSYVVQFLKNLLIFINRPFWCDVLFGPLVRKDDPKYLLTIRFPLFCYFLFAFFLNYFVTKVIRE